MESLRLKTKDYELIVAQHGNFTLVVVQQSLNHKKKLDDETEKEGEAAAAPAVEAKKD